MKTGSNTEPSQNVQDSGQDRSGEPSDATPTFKLENYNYGPVVANFTGNKTYFIQLIY